MALGSQLPPCTHSPGDGTGRCPVATRTRGMGSGGEAKPEWSRLEAVWGKAPVVRDGTRRRVNARPQQQLPPVVRRESHAPCVSLPLSDGPRVKYALSNPASAEREPAAARPAAAGREDACLCPPALNHRNKTLLAGLQGRRICLSNPSAGNRIIKCCHRES